MLCAALLLMTSAFQTYSVEARPYSMWWRVSRLRSFATSVCLQRFGHWFLAMTLALAESFHYYAVLAMVPFGLAEGAVFFKTRKFRWPVWAALVLRSTAVGSGMEDACNQQRLLRTALLGSAQFH